MQMNGYLQVREHWERAEPLEEDIDDALLVAAARANPRAFAPLYRRYIGPIYGYCHLRLGSREAAEDATSEVFLKALAGLEGYRDGAFAAWLYRIARNVVVDAYRRRRWVPMEEAADMPDRALGPDAVAIARSEAEALRRALARLAEDQRAAIELDLAGWTGPQIAAALGRSPGAVRVLRYRAHRRLRAILAAETDDKERGR